MPAMRPSHFTRENLAFALANLAAHKLRSFLTVLGIIVGIVTVVLVASILIGVRRNVVLLFEEFGPNNIFAFHIQGDPYGSNRRPEELTRRPLRLEFAEQLASACPSLRAVAAQILFPGVLGGRPLTAKYAGIVNENILVQGVSWNYAEVTNAELSEGRMFSQDEERRRNRVCVIGANLAKALFPAGNPVGKQVEMDNALYRVLGVFEKRKGSFFGENRQDNVFIIPAATAAGRYPDQDKVVLFSQARPERRASAMEEIEAELRRLRGVKADQPNDFHLSTADQIVQQFDRVTAMIRILTLAISGLGLLVGGIGVMNIMLMSVTQRTREIGIRKAIGARRRDIVTQFLLEAALLTTLGGLFGVALASALGLLLSRAIPNLPATPPLWAVASALTTSAAVGLVFGVWPAVKAARLDPVESLRYE